MSTGKKSLPPLRIGDTGIAPGGKAVIELPIGSMIDYQRVTMTVHVRRSRREGPCLLLTAGIHGDEIVGVEILRRVLQSRSLRSLRGTLIVVPVVNLPAFLSRSRYLPDRRDLNRVFPGTAGGSLGARLVHAFLGEIACHCTHAIDLHAGAVGRPNLPQIRISPGDDEGADMGLAFRSPVVIETSLRDGSLRAHYYRKGIPSILFEAGEALRIDPAAVRYGHRGIFSVMRHLGMLPPEKKTSRKTRTVVAQGTTWVRAPRGGLFTPRTDLGKAIVVGDVLGIVADPFGRHETPIESNVEGVVIGINREGTADEGDALFHVATTADAGKAEAHILHSDRVIEQGPDLPH